MPIKRSNIARANAETWSLVGGIRNIYAEQGVQQYYELRGKEYRNPHFPMMKEVFPKMLNEFIVSIVMKDKLVAKARSVDDADDADDDNSTTAQTMTTLKMLDFSCGAGEMTKIVLQWSLKRDDVAILAVGADPYTREAFKEEVGDGIECKSWSFQDVCNGAIDDEDELDCDDCDCDDARGKKFDFVIISYAIHLLEASLEYNFYNALAKKTRYLVIVSPTKNKGLIENDSLGFRLVRYESEMKIHVRVYESLL